MLSMILVRPPAGEFRSGGISVSVIREASLRHSFSSAFDLIYSKIGVGS